MAPEDRIRFPSWFSQHKTPAVRHRCSLCGFAQITEMSFASLLHLNNCKNKNLIFFVWSYRIQISAFFLSDCLCVKLSSHVEYKFRMPSVFFFFCLSTFWAKKNFSEQWKVFSVHEKSKKTRRTRLFTLCERHFMQNCTGHKEVFRNVTTSCSVAAVHRSCGAAALPKTSKYSIRKNYFFVFLYLRNRFIYLSFNIIFNHFSF